MAQRCCAKCPATRWVVLVNNSKPHGRTLAEIVDLIGDAALGVFLRDLTRRGQEVPLTPMARVYLGDVMTLVGATRESSAPQRWLVSSCVILTIPTSPFWQRESL